jgi:hypothetical protein
MQGNKLLLKLGFYHPKLENLFEDLLKNLAPLLLPDKSLIEFIPKVPQTGITGLLFAVLSKMGMNYF